MDQQRGVIEELQQHIGHLEHLLEIEAASRKKALSTHKVRAWLCLSNLLVMHYP